MSRYSEWAFDEGGTLVPLPVVPAADARVVRWPLVCTGQGKHEQRRLGRALDRRATEQGDVVFDIAEAFSASGDRVGRRRTRAAVTAFRESEKGVGPFLTPRCSCGVRVGQAQWSAIGQHLDVLSGLSIGVLDVSYLP